ncbi:MAG TPA: M20 family peptidase [Ramlibacter sp.]|jgi:carboxypeptidase PM20D1|uniref:M20 family peptidase n=1 Tax=Ramlibacter sp. TaxID=1917967 RepID=UPI002D3DB17C|nr:M20 family peptidase [Ramlibacter sp.]HZY18535.1 M20 family peptidase [Ramlibacter sp.]
MLKRVALVLLALLLLLVAAVAVNTLRQGSRQLEVPRAPALAVDEKAVAEKLASAVRFRTIASRDDPDANAAEFRKLHEDLQRRFPRVHATLKREVVAGYSLLYTWPGSDPQAKPVMFLAHQDVVPISPGTEDKWEVPPFAGEVKGDYVWGRGAWDDKGNLVAQLEAVEMLLASGFQPRQTVYLGFGHDEEIAGLRGAQQMVKLLQERNVRLDFVIDEGLLITEGIMPGLSRPAALIGIAEKGFLSVVMKVPGTPGHSSMPPPKGSSAIGMMSAALRRLDDEQLPAGLRGVGREMFETIAPEMGGFQRVALSNLWLFGPMVQAQLEKGASTNAMMRTTTALTIMKSGNAENVIPGQAEATVNFRLLPGDTIAGVMDHVKAKSGDRFELIALPGAAEPSPVSPTQSSSYQLINRTVRSVFPGTIVAPGLMIAATDSRHFTPVSDHIYRFSPVRAKPEDLSRFHGTNERIATSNLAELVRFYHQLLTNLNVPAT